MLINEFPIYYQLNLIIITRIIKNVHFIIIILVKNCGFIID